MRAIAFSIVIVSAFVVAQTSIPDIAELKTKAAAGDVRAQVALGHAYEDGVGVAQNDEQALKWYRAAAALGDAEAQNDVGVMYRLGHGVNKDITEAEKWFRIAAKQGYAPAMFNLATLYYNDQGVAADDERAYAWFALAERAGSKQATDGVQRLTADLPGWKLRDAKVVLAQMLMKGEEAPPDFSAGVAVLLQLAPQAPELWVLLAKTYMFEPAVPHDYTKAEKYCTSAANANASSGMVCLGYLYGAGLLGPNRDTQAFAWYDKAARLGNTTAWYAVGLMHYYGWGTKKDVQEAYKWLFLAKSVRVAHAQELFVSASAQINAKLAEKLTRKAWEEQSKTYHKKTRLPEINSLRREDMDFILVPDRRPN